MKTILLFSILFCSCTIVFPSLGALTDADLDKIRLIVKDEVKSEINASEKRMKEYINTKNESIDDKFESIEKNFDRQNNIIIACIGIPLAILAIGTTVWGILAHRRSGKDGALEEQIETLTQEIETLKQQRIVNP
ncbi:MAG: hypothetical protein OXI61_12390 [Candidatus Poribacteria bacterium]|nr:hypothetical protein [Candidatus Poribacteria bacterium]